MKKTIFTIATAILLTCTMSITTFAQSPIKTDNAEIKKIITEKLMQNTDLFTEKIAVNVEFLITEKNEMIIVKTNNQDLDYSFKQIFNYQKISNSNLAQNQAYEILVTIQ